MIIRVSQTGGFAGDVTIELAHVDTAMLPAAQAQRLEQLARQALGESHAPDAPTAGSSSGGGAGTIGADTSVRYEVCVEGAGDGNDQRAAFEDNGGGVVASAGEALRPLVAAVTQSGG